MTTKKTNTKTQSLTDALHELLTEGATGTQEEICHVLENQGHEVNQTKISRLLRKLGAVKVKDERGQVVYWLPKEPPPPETTSPVSSLIFEIVANESLILVHTAPGAASLVARLLDYRQKETEIIGTVAGDDAIFVAPKSIKTIDKTLAEVKRLLWGH